MALALALVAVVLAPNAGADPAVAIGPNPVPVGADDAIAAVTVEWSGLAPGQLVYVDICRKSIADWSFNVADDCGAYSRITPNGTPSGAGSSAFEVFRGQDPAGEMWGCYAPGDSPPAGVVAYETCFVRVTDTELSNFDGDSETPFTLEGPPRVDPGTRADGEVATAPSLPTAASAAAAPGAVAAPTGEPAPGESLQVAGAAGVAGVSITG